jgi:hypothetical protein
LQRSIDKLNKEINAIHTDTKMKAQLADLIHLCRFHHLSNAYFGNTNCGAAAATDVFTGAGILELEGGRDGALFFRVYVDVWDEKGSDTKTLSRLEYQAPHAFYLLTREMS